MPFLCLIFLNSVESIAHRDKIPAHNRLRLIQVLPQSRLHDKLEPGNKTRSPVIPMLPVWRSPSRARSDRAALSRLGPRPSGGVGFTLPPGDKTAFWPFYGGADRDRTDDLLLAKQALSQLSYGPGQKPEVRNQKPVPVALASPPSGGSNSFWAVRWWAWEDLNFRPHAYQARALTKLSYRPDIRAKKTGHTKTGAPAKQMVQNTSKQPPSAFWLLFSGF